MSQSTDSELIVCTITLILVILRIYYILPRKPNVRVTSERTACKLAVFLGSGGHTSEALMLISALDFTRYSPRVYVISEGDTLSAQKAADLEAEKATHSTPGSAVFELLMIPRARRVHQSLLTTPPSFLFSLLVAIYYITFSPILFSREAFADVLILNGPGTCFVLCVAVYLNKFLGLPSPKLIYVESFARVTSLSLSGKLLRPLVDRFVVQWPEILKDGGRGECRGWLV